MLFMFTPLKTSNPVSWLREPLQTHTFYNGQWKDGFKLIVKDVEEGDHTCICLQAPWKTTKTLSEDCHSSSNSPHHEAKL
jgi:hypothetical protein